MGTLHFVYVPKVAVYMNENVNRMLVPSTNVKEIELILVLL